MGACDKYLVSGGMCGEQDEGKAKVKLKMRPKLICRCDVLSRMARDRPWWS